MEDEADVYEAMRAQFPMAFGKQSKSQTPLELIHNATRRTPTIGPSAAESDDIPSASTSNSIINDFPSQSSSSLENPKPKSDKGILFGPPRPPVGPPRPPPSGSGGGVEDEGSIIGPPRPPSGGIGDVEDDEGPVIGPPKPPSGAVGVAKEDDDDDGPSIGPPRPPQSGRGGGAEDEGSVIGPPRPPPGGSGDVEDDEGLVIGPPRPPPGGSGDGEDDEGLVIGPPKPPSGGVAKENDDDDDAPSIGPPRPPPGPVETDSEDDDDMDEEDEEEEGYRIPLSNEIFLKGHSKVVSALAVDHSGSRVLSGSFDYNVRMYDFGGMNARLESFRTLEPSEGHQVRSLSWSPTSDRFLCVTGSAQAKIYDRDGLTLGEFVKGDMYIRDLKNTKGHITGLTCGEWHPKAKETILTSSEDGSIRIWDVNDFTTQKQVIKPKPSRPGRIAVNTCTWDCEGKRIAGGLADGSIQIWNVKTGWGSRPDIYVAKGHTDDITGLKFTSDGLLLASRSFDGSLKLWDLRQMKETLHVFDDLPNNYAQCNIALSPDEQLILTGTSVEKDSTTGGLLCFFDRRKLELVSRVGISPKFSVVQCAWHSRLNQIFATTGDKHEGGTHILYDPTISQKGALACVARAPRKQSVDDFQAEPVIHNPHALPLFRDQPSRKRQRDKMLKDPVKSHKPELPMTGPGFGGRVGTTKGSLLTQYLLKQGGLIKETWMDEDPREAILKYADIAVKDPKYIAPAYASTQPETVFAKSDSEEEDK